MVDERTLIQNGLATLPNKLKQELRQKMSLMRLTKAGFFKKADIPHPEMASELLLHRAVLDKALIDSFSPNPELRLEVEDWLDLENSDFRECCEYALLEPEGVFASFHLFKSILKGKNARLKNFGTRNT